MFKHYPARAVYGGTLMITQSFLYNAIFFTYGLVLLYFFHVPSGNTPYYFMAFCVGNLLGPLILGRLFDTIGRRKMISGTYLVSGILLVITAQLFKAGTSATGPHRVRPLRDFPGKVRGAPPRLRRASCLLLWTDVGIECVFAVLVLEPEPVDPRLPGLQPLRHDGEPCFFA